MRSGGGCWTAPGRGLDCRLPTMPICILSWTVADDDRLADDFHDFEPANDWRWTDGSASVPDALICRPDGRWNAP